MDYIDKLYFKMCVTKIGHESDNDIAARCPICGDSPKKYRLHLYEKGNTTLVHCFNGGCEIHMNLYNFLKNYFPNLLDGYKQAKFQNLQNFQNSSSQNIQTTLNGNPMGNNPMGNNPMGNNPMGNDGFKKFKNPFTSIVNQERFLDYIHNRGCYNYEDFFYYSDNMGKITIDDKTFYLKDYIIVPFFTSDDKLYGFYSRNINQKKFFTCCLNNKFKIWNWFKIDKTKPVYIFEGIFDAMTFRKLYNEPNVIAQCGIDIPPERLLELKYPIFCLDNDKVGLNEMLKYVQTYQCMLVNFPEKDFNEFLCRSDKSTGTMTMFELVTGMNGILKIKEKIKEL